ncbi:unnamed protein product [Pieris macdunnoughi]|uniref:CHK kinase-like domain-containing protein n=1 Tax=Pieris macdunnoughi TaxID=345717 RepID=A0A821TJF2_9NEOP|nr:unnamed protein product [Pieris macdunnoughi]
MSDTENILRGVLDNLLVNHGYKLNYVTIKSKPTHGASFSSKLFSINVKSSEGDLKLFAKVGVVRGKCSEWMFSTERFAFNELAKIYSDLQVKYEISEEDRLKFPKFYGSSRMGGKETIILEDLVASGYETFDRFKCFDWEQASNIALYLAKFHALSFAFAKDYPKEFEKVLNMKYEIWSRVNEEDAKAYWAKTLAGSLAVIKNEQRGRVAKFYESLPKPQTYTKPIGTPVLSHGDFRLSNLLYKKTNEKVQAIAVDFQTVYAGCPATDLVYLIFLGSDEEFRAEYYEKLLDHYYNSLSKMMEWLSIDSTEVYPREEFDRDMKENLPYAMLIGATILPTVVVEEDAAPDLGNFDYNQFVMSPNEIFAKRFRGIVSDCIRWNVI